MSCRKLIADYVSQHLHGLVVLNQLPSHAHSTVCHTQPGSSSSTTTDSTPIIATHSGSFHCDEAMACALLRHVPRFTAAQIVRTRDARTIDQCSVVVDVGGVYDAAKLRYDHHQPSFHETMVTARHTYHTRLSSAGLIYKHYGREIIKEFVEAVLAGSATSSESHHNDHQQHERERILKLTGWPADRQSMTSAELEMVYDTVYKNFVEEIDGVDNGVEAVGMVRNRSKSRKNSNNDHPSNANGDEGGCNLDCDCELVHRYSQSTSLSSRVGQLQSWWNDEDGNDAGRENACFVEAVELTAMEFFHAVSYVTFSWLPARSLVEQAFGRAKSVHESGQIVILEERFCPWKMHLLQIEEEMGCVGRVLFVVYSDGKGWRVQAVPKNATIGFENRKSLPYKGLRDDELSAASGIEGGVFVHVSGFIGGMKTREGAMKLAIQALAA